MKLTCIDLWIEFHNEKNDISLQVRENLITIKQNDKEIVMNRNHSDKQIFELATLLGCDLKYKTFYAATK